MLQVVWKSLLLVYPTAFVTNRKVLFWAICNVYLAGEVTELRGTRGAVGYMRAERIVVLYSFSLLCWLRPDNFFSF